MTRIPITLDRLAWIVVADVCLAEANRLSRTGSGRPCLDIAPLSEVNLAVRPVFLREPSREEFTWPRMPRDVAELVVRVLKNAGRSQTAGLITDQLPKEQRRAA